MFSVITVDIDPEAHLGPITLAWRGLTIAIGIYLGMLVAGRWLRRREIDVDPLYTLTALLALGLSNGQWTSIALLLAAIVGRAGVEVPRRRRGAVAVVR